MSKNLFRRISLLIFAAALTFNFVPDVNHKVSAVSYDSQTVSFGPGQAVNLVDALITEVNKATSTIDGAFYEIRYQPFVDALIQAKNRGVAIRIVTDSDYISNTFTQQLINAGIWATFVRFF